MKIKGEYGPSQGAEQLKGLVAAARAAQRREQSVNAQLKLVRKAQSIFQLVSLTSGNEMGPEIKSPILETMLTSKLLWTEENFKHCYLLSFSDTDDYVDVTEEMVTKMNEDYRRAAPFLSAVGVVQ